MITPRTLATVAVLCSTCFCLAQEKADGPTRWAKDMAAFVERDKQSAPPANAVLFVGSSSIRLWDLAASWPDTSTINNGFGGSTLADSIHWFDTVIAPYQPSAIVIYAGDNDISKGLSPSEVEQDFTTLADRIVEAHPDVPVVFIAIKPSRKRWEMWPTMKEANDLVAAACARRENFHFADIAAPMLADEQPPATAWFVEDGLHLSEMGYARWTEIVKTAISAANSD